MNHQASLFLRSSVLATTNHTIKKGTGKYRLRTTFILMIIAIMGVTGFQVYWLKNNYDREKETLELQTQATFRQTILSLQASKLKLEKLSEWVDSTNASIVINRSASFNQITKPANKVKSDGEPTISLINLMQESLKDSLKGKKNKSTSVVISLKNDSLQHSLMDSFPNTEAALKSFITTRSDSFVVSPDNISEIFVLKDNNLSQDKQIVTRQTVLPANDKNNFTIRSKNAVGSEGQNKPGEKSAEIMQQGRLEAVPRGNMVYQFLYNVDSLSQKDSVTVQEIDSAFASRLQEEKIHVDFHVKRADSTAAALANNAVSIGFSKPAYFSFSLTSTARYIFNKLQLPILFSLLLVGITIASFVIMYRNMLQQYRLAELKNGFISNITHELKTPIATVGVALEALKNFNAIHDPARTKEYLDISHNELQRLNLLVDKVLRLSVFEKKEIELQYELVNLQDIVEEVLSSMRLQIEKCQAGVSLNVEGDSSLHGDRSHLMSVVFNLLDNALKYSSEKPEIQIRLEEKERSLLLSMTDNGIGIPAAYKDKVFDKFFRVPHGDTHNAKGYGLGLNYTAHVVQKHLGTIEVESEPGKGTRFIVTLPKMANKEKA